MNDEQDERMPILKDSVQVVDWEQFKKKYYTQENQIQLILKQLNEWHSDISKKLVQIDKSEPICDEDDLENNRKFSSINMSAFSDLLEELNDQMQNMTGMLETMTISPDESQAKLKNNMLRRFREIQDEHEKEVGKLKQQYTNNCRKHSLFKESIKKGRNKTLRSNFSGVDYGQTLQQADAVIDLASSIHQSLQNQGQRLGQVQNKLREYIGEFQGIGQLVRGIRYQKGKQQAIVVGLIVILVLIIFLY